MAGIKNNTARLFNLKCLYKGSRVLIRMAPGFNIVDDEHWNAFVSKDGKRVDKEVARLRKLKHLEFGPEQDDLELEQDADTKSMSKSEPIVKMKAAIDKAKQETDEAEAKVSTAQANEREALARAEKAELELAALKANTPVSVKSKETVKSK